MAANIFEGYNLAVAKVDAQFSDLALNSSNIQVIFKIETKALSSFDPTRAINSITGFERNYKYYIIAKADIDLTAILSTTFSESAGTGSAAILLEGGGQVLTQ